MTDIQDYDPIKNYPEMGTAQYKGQYVFIEWKTIPFHFKSKIIERAQNLALLLNAPKDPDFRSLPCKGLARDNDGGRVAFVFDAPSSTSFPRSLRNHFSLMNPSVTERIRLALQLTQSVKYFHTAGWLHKNLRSENVLFWSSDKAVLSLSQPVLAGFNISRPDSPSEVSEEAYYDPRRDIYRHPDAMGEPSESFSAAKDVYALGTVLLEVGEWRSLKSLVAKVVDVSKPDVPMDSLAKVKPFLLDEGSNGGVLKMLAFRMGEIYANVTKMMLSGEVSEAFEPNVRDEGLVFRPDLLDVAIRDLTRCIV